MQREIEYFARKYIMNGCDSATDSDCNTTSDFVPVRYVETTGLHLANDSDSDSDHEGMDCEGEDVVSSSDQWRRCPSCKGKSRGARSGEEELSGTSPCSSTVGEVKNYLAIRVSDLPGVDFKSRFIFIRVDGDEWEIKVEQQSSSLSPEEQPMGTFQLEEDFLGATNQSTDKYAQLLRSIQNRDLEDLEKNYAAYKITERELLVEPKTIDFIWPD